MVSPLVNTSFTVSAYDKKTGCTNSADIAVYVYTVPVLSVTGPTAICFGDSLKLKVSGANSYTWNSLFSGNTFTTVPVGSAIYFVTGVNYYPLLCRSSSSVHVQVNPLPKLHFAGTFVKCLGDEGNITVYGASTYTWNNNYYQASYPFVFKPDAVTFTVTGVDAEGCSKTSVVTVSVETCTGINETTISGLKIYPNPTNGSFTIETNSDHEKSIMVYDVSGRVLREEQVQFREVSIDLTVMAAGFYFVKVQVGEKIEILRIVKN